MTTRITSLCRASTQWFNILALPGRRLLMSCAMLIILWVKKTIQSAGQAADMRKTLDLLPASFVVICAWKPSQALAAIKIIWKQFTEKWAYQKCINASTAIDTLSWKFISIDTSREFTEQVHREADAIQERKRAKRFSTRKMFRYIARWVVVVTNV